MAFSVARKTKNRNSGSLQQRDTLPPDVPLLVLETAQPVKFADTLREALGDAPPPPEDMRDLETRPQKVAVLAPDAEVVKEYIAQRDVE